MLAKLFGLRPFEWSRDRGLAARLKAADVAEGAAMGWTDTEQALAAGVRISALCEVFLLHGEAHGVWGLSDPHSRLPKRPPDRWGGRGVIWMVTTPELVRYPARLLRTCRWCLARALEVVPVVYNFTLASHVESRRLCRALGFYELEPRPMGPQGLEFVPLCGARVEIERTQARELC